MRLGIISDIHDHLHNLQPVVAWLTGKTDLLICCGDLCSPFIMDELKKYTGPVHIIFGNNDADLYRITRKSDSRVQAQGEFLELDLNGFRIGVNHFDNIAAPIARSGLYDLVCFGHNHRFSLAQHGRTLALNPGDAYGLGIWPLGSRTRDADVRRLRYEDEGTAIVSGGEGCYCARYLGAGCFEYSDKVWALNTDAFSSSSTSAPPFNGISCSTQFDSGMFRKYRRSCITIDRRFAKCDLLSRR